MASLDTDASLLGPAQGAKPPPVIGERDIVFACPNCSGELVVDQDGAGLTVPCPHCRQPLTIPASSSGSVPPSGSVLLPPAAASPPGLPPPPPAVKRQFDFTGLPPEEIERRAHELQHQLKENRSQDTEMRGHVNRATMELHRLQLRLKKLQERQADIEAELEAIQALGREGT